ncbi:MAG: rod shape-determining protein MreD [Chloroflexi bacterium]|nr:MAG: rod shape-determining protein MreD [Chloroflexota bacterium]TMG39917.1 MAG: rod shape-determining protein MreD [Chloroflexota bacterium]
MAATTWSREGSSVRLALGLLIPIAAALLQGTVAPFITIGGARPSLPLLVAAAWSVAAGAREAVWWAFVGGLASDLLSGGPLGAFACASLPPVAAVGLGDRAAGRPTPVLAGALLVGIAALAAALLYLGILAVTGQPIGSFPLEAGTAVAGAIYTGALALVVYPLARLVRRVTEKQGASGW